MDPTQCYLEMLNSMNDGDLTTARQLAVALSEWLAKGGFHPENYPPDEVEASMMHVFRQSAGTGE